MAVKKLQYLAFTLNTGKKGLIAHIYSPPNAARRDWEFGKETEAEVLVTILNSLGSEGWDLAQSFEIDGQRHYVLSR